jgi:tetrathionate reductase subunit B
MKKDRKTDAARRRFLKGLFLGAGGGAVAALPALPRATSRRSGKIQYGMLIDLRKCVGCQSCSIACKSEFDVPLGVTRSWVEYVEKGVYPNVGRTFLPRLCNHCSDPPCVSVCPTGATYKREQDGIVIVDTGVCIGCKYCILACPYDARFLNPVTRFADKCDFCIHRVAKGLTPSCVNTCPAGARVFGDLNDPDSLISKTIAQNRVSVLRPEMGTQPNVYYIDADHSDPNNARQPEAGEVRVATHRKNPKRR